MTHSVQKCYNLEGERIIYRTFRFKIFVHQLNYEHMLSPKLVTVQTMQHFAIQEQSAFCVYHLLTSMNYVWYQLNFKALSLYFNGENQLLF